MTEAEKAYLLIESIGGEPQIRYGQSGWFISDHLYIHDRTFIEGGSADRSDSPEQALVTRLQKLQSIQYPKAVCTLRDPRRYYRWNGAAWQEVDFENE